CSSTARASGRDRACWRARCDVRPWPSVAGLERVRRFRLTMQRHEEFLHVLIEPTLADLIGLDLDERIVSALGANFELRGAEHAGEGALAWTATSLGGGKTQRRRGEKGVGGRQDVGRVERGAIEEQHDQRTSFVSDADRTSCVQSIFSILLAMVSRRNCIPIAQLPDITKLSFAV